jgi:hypothetical protein
VALALVALAVVTLGACGSAAVTREDVIARGDAICSSALRSIRATAPPAQGAGSLAALASYLQRVLPIVDKEAAELRALPRPASGRATLKRYIAAVTGSAAEYGALAAAAARGDRSASDAALAALRADQASALALQYGLTQCAGTAGTGVT